MTKKDATRWVIAAVLVVALACGCAGRPADERGGSLVSEEGGIAFTRVATFEPLEADVYTVDVDGTGEMQLTDSPGLDGFPTWSPDGERVAFVSDRDGNWELYVMAPDGANPRRLTNTPVDEAEPAWSPDGKKIAFVLGFNGDNPSIWTMDADGSDRRRLAGGNWPSWSPDGGRIAYTSGEWNDQRISVMNAHGSERRTLDMPGASQAVWSPDGERFAYVRDVGPDKDTWDDEEIFAMDPDGSDRARLTEIPGNDHWPPTWSPDGTRIAFTSDGTGQVGNICVMNADGSGLTTLTDHSIPILDMLGEGLAYDAFPAWRP